MSKPSDIQDKEKTSRSYLLELLILTMIALMLIVFFWNSIFVSIFVNIFLFRSYLL